MSTDAVGGISRVYNTAVRVLQSSIACYLISVVGASKPPKKRPAITTTTTPWGGTCEIITLKSGDRRRRNELADRAKRLRILQKYGLAPPDASAGKGGKISGGGGKGRGGGDDYDDDGFEGEVRVCDVRGTT